MTQTLHERFLQLQQAERGSVFIMVAFAGFMLIAATGVAVDITRAQILQTKMSAALDAAGLAAGATASSGPANLTAQQWVQQQAVKNISIPISQAVTCLPAPSPSPPL